MTAFISPPPRLQFFTNAGVPMAGGLLYTYAAGTTTPLTTYTDSTGLVANTNPVILDSRGEASIWLGGVGYKFKLATPANVDVWTQDNIAPGSSAYMTYTPAGTGAVVTTVQAKLRESVSVKDFGAVGNGVADDTAAIQAAITFLQGGLTALFFPAGSYKVTATLNVTASMVFFGAAEHEVTITWTNTNLTVFNVVTDNSCSWQNLTFLGPAGVIAGSVIALAGTTNNAHSTVYNCSFIQVYNGVFCTSAFVLKVKSCRFNTFAHYGVHIQNTFNVDAGDSQIDGCTFAGPLGGTNVGVYQESSGGLRILNNKFNTGAYGYVLALNAGAVTGDLLITGNSFENSNVANIRLTSAGSGSFALVTITGNQFALAPINVLVDFGFFGLNSVTMTGNVFALSTLGTACLSLDYIQQANITGNVFNGGGATTPTGILATVNASGVISSNTFTNTTWGAKVTNGSGNLLVLPNRVYTGTVAAVCNAVYGAFGMYSGTAAVVFPFTFAAVPTITTSRNSIGGGVGINFFGITTTGFTYVATSVTNGGAGNFEYVASGLF